MNKALNNNLPPQVRKEATTALNQTIVELVDLFACLKHAHWNIQGATFIKLDELAGQIMDHIDRAAERSTELGGLADGAFCAGVKLPPVRKRKDAPASLDGFYDYLRELADLYDNTAEHLRQAVKRVVALQDFALADLLADIVRTLDLHVWLLAAHLAQQQLNPRINPCFTRSLSS